MKAAILTVGDEVLSGDIANANAQWLATRLNERGVTVRCILTLPDDRKCIEETIREWTAAFDAVIVTGGLGGTHDDVTGDAVADAFDRELVIDESVRKHIIDTVAESRDTDPEMVTTDGVNFDVDAWAKVPESSRPLLNPEGLCPGCVIDNVYMFPGVPSEMQALFEKVAAEFNGDVIARKLSTPHPEGSIVEELATVRDRFDVTVGSYPTTDGDNGLKVTGTNPETVDDAIDWLSERIEISVDA